MEARPEDHGEQNSRPVPGGAFLTGEEIARALRARIVDGEFRPGDQLPSRLKVCEEYGSTPVTVQRAFARLGNDGFVVSRFRQGTFVADNPPHLAHYGIVFPSPENLREKSRVHFWKVLSHQADRLAKKLAAQGRRISKFSFPRDDASIARFQELTELVETDRIAGLLFVTDPYTLTGSTVLTHPNLPRIAVATNPANFDGATLNLGNTLHKALDYLQQSGRKRVSVLSQFGQVNLKEFRQLVDERGLQTRPYWIQGFNLGVDEQWTRNLVELMLRNTTDDRPDSLIITDDSLVEPITRALVEFGVSVPDEMAVVAHANFPEPTKSHVPAVRFGANSMEAVQAALDWIDAERAQESPPRRIRIQTQTVLPGE